MRSPPRRNDTDAFPNSRNARTLQARRSADTREKARLVVAWDEKTQGAMFAACAATCIPTSTRVRRESTRSPAIAVKSGLTRCRRLSNLALAWPSSAL